MTARHGKPIRDAVAALAEGLVDSLDESAFNTTFLLRWSLVSPRIVQARLATRIAWNLVYWLYAAESTDGDSRMTLVDAEQWFCGNVSMTVRADVRCILRKRCGKMSSYRKRLLGQ